MIEFDLYKDNPERNAYPRKVKVAERVVCFAPQRFTHDAIEIGPGEPMPEKWHPDYDWSDLNILTEVVGIKVRRTKEDLMGTRHFIQAFGEGSAESSSLFMHVWHSRIPE